MTKQPKSEVNYSRGMKESHCGQSFEDDRGYCKYFIERGEDRIGKCQKVAGSIDRVYWCKLFAKARS